MRGGETMRKQYIPLLLCLLIIPAAAALNPPRMRPSPYFGNILGMKYTGIEDLGDHNYEGGLFAENNALLYTAAAGYIDLGHLRESADRTRYIFELCFDNIQTQKSEFLFEVIEPAEYHVQIDYPENWGILDVHEKYRISREISIDLGQYFAHQSLIWHEIVTWFGYASTGLLSEKASSFSWEDSYSDLLGTKIAAEVLRENKKGYDLAVTEMIVNELRKLDPQPPEIAEQATERIKGKWYSGRYPFVSMKKRNFDVGFDDCQITPFRVPGICPDTPAIPCTVPRLDSLAQYGFTMHLTMTPRESERKEVLRIIYPHRRAETLTPEKDFPAVIRHIRREAVKKEGSLVDKPAL